MEKAKFVPAESQMLNLRNGDDGKGFGMCAKTFFFLIAQELGLGKLNVKTVRGPALRPRFFRNVPKYDDSEVLASRPKNGDWEVSFGIAALQKEIPQGPAVRQASIATGSGTAAGAPAKAATGFKARE
ncbi:hypothetical protein OEA41_003060 [Lepraria neglecta]|uniref:Uncharacterized protein n=1 Tax=Lepraria neglecta TaxID=209136 RepID=A0AAD9Z540_9LECA|nr:hypothetical protein OEA41_003060 [Lepraria neglecta]